MIDIRDFELNDVWLGPCPARIALVTDHEMQRAWADAPDEMLAFSEEEEDELWDETFEYNMDAAHVFAWQTQIAFDARVGEN